MSFQSRACTLFLVATVMTTAGCATTSALSKVRDEAKDAHRISEQALTTAQEANSRSIRTEEMVNRSFRHSMKK